MSNFHAWKRRLWGPDYPFENGPAFIDPNTGNPMLPGGAQSGPLNGIDDTVEAVPANTIDVTFTGPATADTDVALLVYDTGAANPEGKWTGCIVTVADTSDATAIAAAVAAAFDAQNWNGFLDCGVAAGVVTLKLSGAGTIDSVTVLYKNP
jgi:hypothetical protein